MKYRTTAIAIAAAAIMVAGIFGCAGPTQLESNWGRSFEQARARQTLHPNTGRDTTPVEGLSGASAIKSLERQQEGCRDKKKSSSQLGVLTIEKK